jgi:4-hydroxy-tetrahydrodipicolinate synthase
MSIFKGSGVAIVTPMKENGEVDQDVLDQLLDDQIEHGTDAIIICGTTGEGSTLTPEEHIETIRHTIRESERPHPGHCRHRLE